MDIDERTNKQTAIWSTDWLTHRNKEQKPEKTMEDKTSSHVCWWATHGHFWSVGQIGVDYLLLVIKAVFKAGYLDWAGPLQAEHSGWCLKHKQQGQKLVLQLMNNWANAPFASISSINQFYFSEK